MAQPDNCLYCPWKTEKAGRWAKHHQLRWHVQDQHPAEFARMRAAEQKVCDAFSAAYHEFGLATRQRY